MDLENVPFDKQNQKKWIPNNSNVPQQALDLSYEELNTSLLKFESNKDWSIIKNDICKNISPESLLQSFSMYAHVNDHKNWKQTIIRLNKLLYHLSTYEPNTEEDTTIQDYGDSLIELLITKEMKIVYRALNNLRGSITNPILRLLRTVVKFRKGKFIDLFMSYFDFSLPSLSKILTPHKNELNKTKEGTIDKEQHEYSLRYNFIKFFADLLTYSPAILRKDLIIENNKIMVTLSKYISKVDSDECTMLLISTFVNKVIKETTFKKATKCKIFHEFLLLNILKKYQNIDTSKECKKMVMEFFLLLFTDSELGMVFENSKPWNDLSNIGQNTVTINGKRYKLNNKYIFNTVSKFRPWEDEIQLNTLIRILHKIPELVAPYVNHLSYINGNNEPKLTSFWIGQTLTLNKIINLPIPDIALKEDAKGFDEENDDLNENFTSKDENNYSLQILTDIILPPSITLANLRQYINNESLFIKHLGCQCVVFILKKLNLITENLKNKNSNNINFANTLVNEIQHKLPEFHEYLKIIESLYKENDEQNHLLLVSELTLALSLYTNTFTNFNNHFKLNNQNIYNSLIVKGSDTSGTAIQLNGLELNVVDKYMELQELNDSYKWWNKNNSELSLFTSLLKMAATNDYKTTKKIVRILENLISSSQTFNQKIIVASPVVSMLESLKNHGELEMINIWKMIDQCIQRTITSPYKYIDMSVKYNCCSPLMCCFIEQLPFFTAGENETIEKKWTVSLMKKLYIIGDYGLKQLILDCDIIDSKMVEEHWLKEEYLESDKMIQNLNEFCELVFSISDYNNDQVELAIHKIDNFLDNCSLNEKQKISTCNIFDKILLTENNQELLTLLLIVLKKHGATLNLTKTPGIFDHWISLLSTKNTKLILSIINQLDSDSFITFISHKEFDIKQLNSHECYLLILSKLFAFGLIDTEISKSILYSLLLKSGSFIPNELFDLMSEKIDISQLISGKDKLIKSKKFLEILTNKHPLESLVYFESCYANQDEKSIPMLIYFASLCQNLENPEILQKLSQETFALIEIKDDLSLSNVLPFAADKVDYTNQDNQEKLIHAVTYLTTGSSIRFSSSVIQFIHKLVLSNKIEVDLIKVWYYKVFLYINQKSAIIDSSEGSDSSFLQIFAKLEELMNTINPWEYVPKVIFNTCMEIVLLQGWAFKKEVISFFITLTEKSYDAMLETNKGIQFILNNKKNPFKNSSTDANRSEIINLTSILLNSFYFKNIKLNSDINIALQFVENYEGTVSLKDRIFYQIIQSIESITNVSWTQRIGSWDFIEIDEELSEDQLFEDEKLITKERELFTINFNKHMIMKTINDYRFVENKNLPTRCISFKEWNQILVEESLISEVYPVIYDTRFIMLLTLQNKDLVNTIDIDEDEDIEVTKFNFKSLFKSGLFSLMIVSLSYNNDDNSKIAYQILQHMVNTLPKNEKENAKLKVDLMVSLLLKKINFTFFQDKSMLPADFAPPIFWYIISQICFIVLEPKHFLYEQVYKWCLSKPKLVKYELPLLNIFINFQIKNQDFENLNKCLNWLLRNINNGLKTVDDINYLKLIKMFDFLLNFSNNCYASKLVQVNLNKFVYNLQKIVNDYSIITRYGVLSSLEARKYINDFKVKHKNINSNNEDFKEYLMILQDSLNIKELIVRFGVQLKSNKRLLEWTEDDGMKSIKRVCK